MNAPAKLGAYAVVLALMLGAGAGVGAAVGPLDDDEPASSNPMDTMTEEGSDMPAGLSASEAGYTFAPTDTTFTPGLAEAFTFTITGPDGGPITGFESRHERALHLVIVSSDLADYQHLHPTLSRDGTWSAKVSLPRPGLYRAYADFAATGAEPMTLAAQLTAGGELAPQPLPAQNRAAVVDGYEVHLDGDIAAGQDSELRFRVARAGAEVTDLEPYLGAFGHLVAIRALDQAYLHVHPTEASSPAEVVFAVHAPSPGSYRLFLDYQHDGVVHTAAFTIEVPAANASAPTHSEETTHGH